jgi:phage replication O-like protein O
VKQPDEYIVVRPFAPGNNYTRVHNAIFDLMPHLSGAEWKILCFIIRKTSGYQKEVDAISYSQIIEGTGVKNRAAVSNALHSMQGLEKMRDGNKTVWVRNEERVALITCYDGANRRQSLGYSVNQDCEILVLKKKKQPVTKTY